MPDDPWRARNSRRLDLIDRKHRVGLGPDEAAELDRLAAELADHLAVAAPRPTDVLDALAVRIEDRRRRISAREGRLDANTPG